MINRSAESLSRSYSYYFGPRDPAFEILAFEIVDGRRVLRATTEALTLLVAEGIFNHLGPHYDVVQLWSKDLQGHPVYRQF